MKNKEKAKATKSVTKAGRPTKYSKEMDTKILAFGKKGMSISEMITGLGIKSSSTFYGYAKKYKSFEEAIEHAKLLSQSHWEAKLTALAEGTGNMSQVKIVEFVLKNRFRQDYQPDQAAVQVNVNNTEPKEGMTEAELDEKIRRLQKKLGIRVIEDTTNE